MGTTQPIRDISEIEELKNYYYYEKPNLRNYALICLGINSALRISDLLTLRWDNVYDFMENHFYKHIIVIEQKTRKQAQIALNKNARHALDIYKNSILQLKPEDFLFPGKTPSSHLSRSQAFRLIKEAGQNLHFETSISCHSLRKTFGYHAWKSGAQPAILMNIYNHSSFHITKRYLGIDQDDKDQIFLEVNL
jgi:integrase